MPLFSLFSSALALFSLALPGLPSRGPEGCVLTTALALPPYGAAQGAQGEMQVQVRCPDAARRFRLTWPGAAVKGAALEVTLSSGLRLTLPGAASELTGGRSWMGSQTLRFAVRAEAGQWGVRRGPAPLPPLVLTEGGAS